MLSAKEGSDDLVNLLLQYNAEIDLSDMVSSYLIRKLLY